jgi:glycosyltransferase involved in cell wall biosynthesis
LTDILLSLITPSFNQVDFVEPCIKSITTQKNEQIEYLIYDNLSTDGSVDVIYKNKKDIDFIAIEKDSGQADAINKGIYQSKGKYIGYINSDDLLAPGAIQILLNYLKNTDKLIFIGDCVSIDRQGNVLKRKSNKNPNYKNLLFGNSLSQPSVFIDKDFITSNGCFDSRLNWCLDWALFIKLLYKVDQDKIQYIPEVLSFSREYGETKTNTGFNRKAVERLSLLHQYFSSFLKVNLITRLLSYSAVYYVLYCDYNRNGKLLLSYYALIQSFCICPFYIIIKMLHYVKRL